MSARKAKIKILKSKNNKNLKDDILEANIEYINSTSNPTSPTSGGDNTKNKKRKSRGMPEWFKPFAKDLKALKNDFNTIVSVNNLKRK